VPSRQRDCWAEWLAERRSGGDAEVRRQLLEELVPVRDKVLDRAKLAADETLLDVGCGEGLIGFGALERGAGRVIFTDISEDLLDACRAAADELGLDHRCDFMREAAEDLSSIQSETVDVVATRSVLIYVKKKEQALEEFFRVLRSGGRISLYEPINRFGHTEGWEKDFWWYPSDGLAVLAEKVNAVYAALQPPSDPMLDFDERDLLRVAESAGFFPIELELQAEIRELEPRPWEAFLHSSGNPKIPTFAEAMDQALTPEERERVVEHLRPLVERGDGVWRMAHAYVAAAKP
jgi:arsenite methyltransferase